MTDGKKEKGEKGVSTSYDWFQNKESKATNVGNDV